MDIVKERIKDRLISKIKEISEKYKYYGFWKLGASYVIGVSIEENPYLHFPSVEYAYNALMEEIGKLSEKDFEPIIVDKSLCFSDGEKLVIPVEVLNAEPKISIDGVNLILRFKGFEDEYEIFYRLWAKIWENATNKYIESLE